MGQIVAAGATVHAPQFFSYPPTEDFAQLDASIAAMRQLGHQMLDDTKPDAVIVIGSDHLETFFLSAVPTFALIGGERVKAAFAGRSYDLPCHPMSEGLIEHLVASGFDMVYSQDAVLGHAFAAPFEWVIEKREIPVVAMFVNTYLPPLPTARRCAALGEAIASLPWHAPGTSGDRRLGRSVALSRHMEILRSPPTISIAGRSPKWSEAIPKPF